MEKQLSQGILESSYLVELLRRYCGSIIVDEKLQYRDEILSNTDSYVLSVKYKFAFKIQRVLLYVDNGKWEEGILLLKEALHIDPKMSAVLSHLTRYLSRAFVG